MKSYNNKISNLLSQIRELDTMILLHKQHHDDMMMQQYQARKLDFLKELATELISLNASTPRIYETIKAIITKIEAQKPILNEAEISKQFQFSLTELETVLEGV
ncbi:hypothetical protein EOM75_14085 [Candidatus Falkowbacteria bacterium]|jgi:hypothetical protein|nr:hypothetical protein [Bacteroidales bacterium]MDD4176723.1 hypothetical protein [Bacteroidales bacterium]MDD4742085.1 hypothetical protein [Bacteroidales bacterium]NCU37126.1 hypothetical protein [Candidatus Falkowbacteria bacterium]